MPRSSGDGDDDDDDDDDDDEETLSDLSGPLYEPVNESDPGSSPPSPEQRRALAPSVWGGNTVSSNEKGHNSNPLSKSQYLSHR